MKLFLGLSLSILTVIGLAGCNNGDGGLLTEPPALPNNIIDLIVTPKMAQSPQGFTVRFKAEAVLSDGQVLDVTNQEALNWQSSN
ncbi:hypothetical protein, partial [Vibrio splendidus]|uniref:hypothetical protein n=1 Tax=Vibrio splendidus TaxID=29497 RepID=UPI000515D814